MPWSSVITSQTPAPSTDLAPVDPTLLDGAALYLNRPMLASGLQLAVTISDYDIATFFGGDFALLASKDPHKTARFAALSQRADL